MVDHTGNWPELSTIFTVVAIVAIMVAVVAVVAIAAPVPAVVTVGGTGLSTAAVTTTVAAIVSSKVETKCS